MSFAPRRDAGLRSGEDAVLNQGFAAGVAGCLLFVLICGGCGPVKPDRKATYPVTGLVLVDGKPGPAIKVELTDVKGIDREQPTVSHTFTGTDGKFAISTYENGDGVPEGDYILTFYWGELHPLSMQYGGEDKLKNRYSDPEKSTFKVKVEKDKPVDLGTIELTTN